MKYPTLSLKFVVTLHMGINVFKGIHDRSGQLRTGVPVENGKNRTLRRIGLVLGAMERYMYLRHPISPTTDCIALAHVIRLYWKPAMRPLQINMLCNSSSTIVSSARMSVTNCKWLGSQHHDACTMRTSHGASVMMADAIDG